MILKRNRNTMHSAKDLKDGHTGDSFLPRARALQNIAKFSRQWQI